MPNHLVSWLQQKPLSEEVTVAEVLRVQVEGEVLEVLGKCDRTYQQLEAQTGLDSDLLAAALVSLKCSGLIASYHGEAGGLVQQPVQIWTLAKTLAQTKN